MRGLSPPQSLDEPGLLQLQLGGFLVRQELCDVFERPVSIASADLILLSVGGNDLNPPGDLSEKIVINEPTANTLMIDMYI